MDGVDSTAEAERIHAEGHLNALPICKAKGEKFIQV